MLYVFVPTIVISIVEFLKRLFPENGKPRDYRGAAIIVLSAVVGGIAGAFSVEGLTIVTGILVGLTGAGIMRVGQALGSGR